MNKNTPLFLIVDESKIPENAAFTRMKSQGVHCMQVQSAADCLKTVIQKNIGLVVVDENLPDLSGLTLVSLLKKMKPDIEIIFTTSSHNPQKEIDARLAGILYYAVKPIDWTLLTQIIERTLSNQNRKIELTYNPTQSI